MQVVSVAAYALICSKILTGASAKIFLKEGQLKFSNNKYTLKGWIGRGGVGLWSLYTVLEGNYMYFLHSLILKR